MEKSKPRKDQQWGWRRKEPRFVPVNASQKRPKTVFVTADGRVEPIEEPIVWCNMGVL